MGSVRGCELILPVGKRRPEASLVSAIREARGLLGGATKELHGLYAQGEALAVLALVHVEVGELLYAVQAVADGVAVGEEVGGGLRGGGVVAEVGHQGSDELCAVARVVGDYRREGL